MIVRTADPAKSSLLSMQILHEHLQQLAAKGVLLLQGWLLAGWLCGLLCCAACGPSYTYSASPQSCDQPIRGGAAAFPQSSLLLSRCGGGAHEWK